MRKGKVKNKLLLILMLVMLFVSCSGEEFTLSSPTLTRDITIENDARREEAEIRLSISSQSGSDDTYTFLLVSPSGTLRWEGGLEKSGDCYTSPSLGITPSASFEEGEYSLIVYSGSGETVTIPVVMAGEEGDYSFGNIKKHEGAEITMYDSQGSVVEDENNAVSGDIKYRDRYSNNIRIHLEFDT